MTLATSVHPTSQGEPSPKTLRLKNRKRGQPQNTWQRDLEADAKKACLPCGQLERLAQNRSDWSVLVSGACPRQDHRLSLIDLLARPFFLTLVGLLEVAFDTVPC